jgi:hypothetical protein
VEEEIRTLEKDPVAAYREACRVLSKKTT